MKALVMILAISFVAGCSSMPSGTTNTYKNPNDPYTSGSFTSPPAQGTDFN